MNEPEAQQRVPPIGGQGCPPYQRGAVELGPFEVEPVDLFPIVAHHADGSLKEPDLIAASSAAWMVGALESAGVRLGQHDRFVAALLALDGWSIVQVVAGWVARAQLSGGPDDRPETSP